ncbi:MAG: hypothetical protein ACYC28_15510 [Longimicrobiales bacterium]
MSRTAIHPKYHRDFEAAPYGERWFFTRWKGLWTLLNAGILDNGPGLRCRKVMQTGAAFTLHVDPADGHRVLCISQSDTTASEAWDRFVQEAVSGFGEPTTWPRADEYPPQGMKTLFHEPLRLV